MNEKLTDGGLPTEFLEAYPFPAFVLLVRPPGIVSPPPVKLPSLVGSIAAEKPAKASSLDDSPSVVSNKRDASRERAHDTGVLDEARSYLWECPPFARHRIPPVSAPLTSAPRLVWANKQWLRISKGREMHEVVGGHTLAALQEWAEMHTPAGSDTPTHASCFQLQLGRTAQVIDLVKSRRPVTPNDGSHSSLVVLTAVGPPRSDTTARQVSELPLATPSFKPPHDITMPAPIYAIMIPHRTRRQSGKEVSDSIRKHPVIAQCHVLLEEVDWSATSIGPRDAWPTEIKTFISLAFSSFTKDCIFVGPELIMIYNQNYSRMVGHPQSFGRPLSQVWEPLWGALKPMFDRVLAGEPMHRENDLILHQRDDRGRFVERYQSYSLIPIVDGSRRVVGIYAPSQDSTPAVLAERRLDTTRDLVESISQARTSTEFYKVVCESLEQNPADAPFVICYSVKKRESPVASASSTVVDLELQSTLGVPDGHACVPAEMRSVSLVPNEDYEDDVLVDMAHLRLNNGETRSPASTTRSQSTNSSRTGPRCRDTLVETNPTAWPIARALATRQCVVVDGCSDLVKGFKVRHWDKLPDLAIVIPLAVDVDGPPPAGVIILGLNLFRPLDTEYDNWIQVNRGHLTSALDSVIAFEEEATRRAEHEKLERAKSTWFRGSAHEFQTPLNLIVAPLEDMQDTELSPSQRQALALAMRNVHRLQSMVSSLLEFTRMEAGHVTAQLVPTDLGPFIEQLMGLFEPVMERLGVHSFVSLEDQKEPTNVDPALIEMVLSHLLVTALKSAEHSRVSTVLRYSDDYATIEVANVRLRTPNAGTDLSTASEHWSPPSLVLNDCEEVGIGLALARRIVHLHGGELWSEKETHLGSHSGPGGIVITARLPLNLPPSEARVPPVPFGAFARQMAKEVTAWANVEERDATSTHGHEAPNTFAEGLMFERTDILLVVHDNADAREYTKCIFSPFCTVIEAATGAEALALTKNTTPDLVLFDWIMRPMGGMELLNALRSQPATKFVPVLVIATASDDESRVEAYMAGVDDYLVKPLRSKEILLRAHLHMQMGKKRAKLEKLFAEQLLEVERRRREAEESKQHQEFLVDLISHEIRTPVSAILQCSSLVKENLVALKEQLRFSSEKGFRPSTSLLADLEEDVGALDSIYQCGLVQERIAGDVLSLAGIQRQMLSFHDVEIDVRREARKVLSVFVNEARMKRIELELTFGETFEQLGIEVIKTDPVRLGQVITNLISNAIRFTSQSEVRKVTVHMEAGWEPPAEGSCGLPSERSTRQLHATSEEPMFMFVSVTDTGPGIKESEQAALFHSFHQGNKMIHTRYGGSGLGLFICKNITGLLGGAIEVQSTLGRGTTFRFYIKAIAVPLAPSPPRPTVLSPSHSAPLPSPPHTTERDRFSSFESPNPLRVLIVEDNIINQTVLKRQLLKEKFVCDVANDGEEALIAIHEAHRQSRYGGTGRAAYDVILMDLEMPVMDGIQAIRHIREAEATAALHPQLVIALTGNARQGQMEQALAAGMDDVVVKPYRLPDLIAKLRHSVAEFRKLHWEERGRVSRRRTDE